MEKTQCSQEAEKIVNITNAEQATINSTNVKVTIQQSERLALPVADAGPSLHESKWSVSSFLNFVKKPKTIVAAVLCITVLIGATVIIHRYKITKQNENAFIYAVNDIGETASQSYLSKDYLTAASLYHDLSLYAYDKYSLAFSRAYEARCYYIASMTSEDTSLRNTYIRKAHDICKEIYSTCKGTPYYYYALSFLSHCYESMGYKYNKQEWVEIIKILEDVAEKDQSGKINCALGNNTSTVHEVMSAVYTSLANYYGDAPYEDLPEVDLESRKKKTAEYLHSIDEHSSDISDGMITVKVAPQAIAADVELELATYLSNEEVIGRIQEIIDECEGYLSEFSYLRSNEYAYVLLNKVIGRGYCMISLYYDFIFHDDEQSGAYKTKSYQQLCPLLYIETNDSDVIDEQVFASLYIYLTELCSGEDLSQMMRIFSTYFRSSSTQNTSPQEFCMLNYSYSILCLVILQSYGEVTDVVEFGLNCIEQANSMKSTLQDELYKESIDSICNVYDTYRDRGILIINADDLMPYVTYIQLLSQILGSQMLFAIGATDS